jgi:hypothetical protein
MFVKIIAQSEMAMDNSIVQRNIEDNLKRGLPELHELPSWKKFKGEHPIAIVGGGPSLTDTLDELRSFRHVMVCGSAHDYLIEQGFEPEFAVVLDPDPIAANYIRKPCKTTTYFVASNCDASVFEALKHHQIVLWHCAGTVPDELVPIQNKIGGGCTVVLRSIGIALLMGYGNQHFFGFDSCMKGDQHHAYPAEDVDEPVEVRMIGSDRIYWSAPYQLAQAQQFQDILRQHGKFFTPTIHGDGLISEIMRMGQLHAEQQENAA